MDIPESYGTMTNCPVCSEELIWVATPIDDIKECPGNLEHTIILNNMPFPNEPKLTMEIVYMDADGKVL